VSPAGARVHVRKARSWRSRARARARACVACDRSCAKNGKKQDPGIGTGGEERRHLFSYAQTRNGESVRNGRRNLSEGERERHVGWSLILIKSRQLSASEENRPIRRHSATVQICRSSSFPRSERRKKREREREDFCDEYYFPTRKVTRFLRIVTIRSNGRRIEAEESAIALRNTESSSGSIAFAVARGDA